MGLDINFLGCYSTAHLLLMLLRTTARSLLEAEVRHRSNFSVPSTG